jgi:hypothetical protein
LTPRKEKNVRLRKSAPVVLLVVFVAVGAAFGQENAPQKTPPKLERIGLELDVQPAKSPADAYVATAVIKDLDSGDVVSAPRVTLRKGEEAKVRSGVEPGADISLTVLVNNEEDQGIYSCEVRRGGKVISSQRATFRFAR